jgi:hypothetical protein
MIFCNINEGIEETLDYRKHFSDVISSDNKIQSNGVAFISFDGIELGCIMTYKKTGRVATQVDRITFRNPILLEQNIKINDIVECFSNNLKSHFQRQTESHISVLSDKVEKELLSFFKKVHPYIYDEIKELQLRLKNNIPHYSDKAQEIIAQEKDAVNLVFKMFNFEEADLPVWSSSDNSAPFLNGYSHLTVREDPMINHDSQVFGDWSKVGQFAQGAVEFEKENQKITLMNVNRQPLEKTLGVDLLIYHHTYKSYIMIQYKRMVKENELFVYRPTDSSYESEIKRMIAFTKTLKSDIEDSIENYRLNNELFYFKLCPARIENSNSNKMVSGMYIPLKLWEILLADKSTDGSKGGKQLSFKNTGRYFHNSQFVNLAQNGWIGSLIKDSSKITEIIMSSINSDNSLTIAEYELNEEK